MVSLASVHLFQEQVDNEGREGNIPILTESRNGSSLLRIPSSYTW